MRITGTLTDWKDDKGFGFVTPVGVGAKVFVHIKAFPRDARRPKQGDRLTYEVDPGASKGPRAVRVQFADGSAPVRSPPLRPATIAALAFVAALAGGVALQRVQPWVGLLVLVASAFAFLAYALDKHFAQAGKRRVPEDVLHFLAAVGGWPGAAFAQQWLRHKSIKRSFQVAYWLTVALNVATVAWVVSPALRRLAGH